MPAPRPRTRPRTRTRSLATAALLALVAGCDDAPRPRSAASSTPAPAPAPAEKPAPIQTRETLNRTTQDIRRFDEETARGGQVAPGKVTEKGYLAVVGNTYVVAMDKIAEIAVTQGVETFAAENDGHYPKDYNEFMEGVIKHYNIALPMLPYYQEYSYDEKNHKLVVLEYPAKKAQRERERDGK